MNLSNPIYQLQHRYEGEFVRVSKVLLYGYPELSKGAILCFELLLNYDWSTKGKPAKGFVFPSAERLAEIREVSVRTVQRWIRELVRAKLVYRQRRQNKASQLHLNHFGKTAVERYFNLTQKGEPRRRVRRRDTSARVNPKLQAPDKFFSEAETTKLSVAYRGKEEDEVFNTVNVNQRISKATGPQQIGVLLKRYQSPQISPQAIKHTESLSRREYLANTLAEALVDRKSLGCYRRLADKLPHQVLFELLSQVKDLWRRGRVRGSPGAVFVALAKRYAQRQEINLFNSPPVAVSAL